MVSPRASGGEPRSRPSCGSAGAPGARRRARSCTRGPSGTLTWTPSLSLSATTMPSWRATPPMKVTGPSMPDALEQRERPVGERVVDAAQDVLDRHAFGDVVDDLGLGQHRADARDGLRPRGAERHRADVGHGHLEVLRRALEEAARARRALLVHVELLDLAAVAQADRARALRADVEDEARRRGRAWRRRGRRR